MRETAVKQISFFLEILMLYEVKPYSIPSITITIFWTPNSELHIL